MEIFDFVKNIDISSVKAGVGLLFLIAVNIILGGLQAKITNEFDWPTMKNGIIKGIIVCVCIVVVYFVGLLNYDIVAVSIGGVEMNLAVAVTTMVMASFVWYAYQVVQKIANVLNIGSKFVDEKKEEGLEIGSETEQ